MTARGNQRIDIGFNLFVYAALNGKRLDRLDDVIRGTIREKEPYKSLMGAPRNERNNQKWLLKPVAKAVGIDTRKMMQTQAETVRDLARADTSVRSLCDSIDANLSVDENGRGEGEVACYFSDGRRLKMTMLLGIDTSKPRKERIASARFCFPASEKTIEFEIPTEGLSRQLMHLVGQFEHSRYLKEGLDIFGKGHENIAEHLVTRYRELEFEWNEKEDGGDIRTASFDEETYEVSFDNDKQIISVSSVWCGRFRFDAACEYTDYMELDLATICDVKGYEDAVYMREMDRELERQEEETLRQEFLRNLQAAVEEAVKKEVSEAIMEELASARPEKGKPKRPVERVHVGDLVVRTGVRTCGHEHHEIREVTALVNVFSPRTGVTEVAVDAFCCPECRRYYVLERDFDRLARRGSLCCRVVVRAGKLQEFIPSNYGELAEVSFFKQLGYSAAKEEGLSDVERRAILDFAIENKFKTQKQTISFLEWLIRFNGSRKGMGDAVRKWESDIKYLISGRGRKAEKVKIDRVFLSKHRWEKTK